MTLTKVAFGAQFLFNMQRPTTHNEVKTLEAVLKSQDCRIAALTPLVSMPNLYYKSRKPIVLTTTNPLPNTPAHWVENQQHGQTVWKQWEPLLNLFGLRPIDDTILDRPLDDMFARERWTFNTTNPRTWTVILDWLKTVDADKARYIEKTGDWWSVYPPRIAAILKPKTTHNDINRE